MTTPTTATIDMMTLNTWGFRWPLARDRKHRFARINAHLRETRYDVVALQELWAGARTALGDTGLTWAADDVQQERGTRMLDSGLGVKVRRGVERGVNAVKSLVRSFKHHTGWDRVKTKGILGVEVPVGDVGFVTLVNTHLQAERKHARVRRTQLDEILQAVDRIESPVILCGDFNLFGDLPEDRAGHQSLAAAGFRDASETIDQPHATYLQRNPYVGGSTPDERFDRIYLRDGAHNGKKLRLMAESVRVIVDHDAPMSDHEAVAARLRLSR
ncbi:MAG: endonuclease/exonuclease/phosphatase family protein [Myxococcota bacterium]